MERYQLQQSEEHSNYYICTDTKHLILCKFEAHNFNHNQEFMALTDEFAKGKDDRYIADVMTEMSQWLIKNHSNKLY